MNLEDMMLQHVSNKMCYESPWRLNVYSGLYHSISQSDDLIHHFGHYNVQLHLQQLFIISRHVLQYFKKKQLSESNYCPTLIKTQSLDSGTHFSSNHALTTDHISEKNNDAFLLHPITLSCSTTLPRRLLCLVKLSLDSQLVCQSFNALYENVLNHITDATDYLYVKKLSTQSYTTFSTTFDVLDILLTDMCYVWFKTYHIDITQHTVNNQIPLLKLNPSEIIEKTVSTASSPSFHTYAPTDLLNNIKNACHTLPFSHRYHDFTNDMPGFSVNKSITETESWPITSRILRHCVALTTAESSTIRRIINLYMSEIMECVIQLFRIVLKLFNKLQHDRSIQRIEDIHLQKNIHVGLEQSMETNVNHSIEELYTTAGQYNQSKSEITSQSSQFNQLPYHLTTGSLNSSPSSGNLGHSNLSFSVFSDPTDDITRPLCVSQTYHVFNHCAHKTPIPAASLSLLLQSGIRHLRSTPYYDAFISEEAITIGLDYAFHRVIDPSCSIQQHLSLNNEQLSDESHGDLGQQQSTPLSLSSSVILHNESYPTDTRCKHITTDNSSSSCSWISALRTSLNIVSGDIAIVILISGAAGCGKSTLACSLANRLGFGTVLSTDTVRHILRSKYTKNENPILYASTYETEKIIISLYHTQQLKGTLFLWDDFTDRQQNIYRMMWCSTSYIIHCDTIDQANPTTVYCSKNNTTEMTINELHNVLETPLENIIHDDSVKNTLEIIKSLDESDLSMDPNIIGYLSQSEMLYNHLECIIEQLLFNGESVVVEGVHLTSRFINRIWNRFKHRCIPFLIYISKEDTHIERFANRSKNFNITPRNNKYIQHLKAIRSIQEYLLKQAKFVLSHKPVIHCIENTTMTSAMRLIHSTVVEQLKKLII